MSSVELLEHALSLAKQLDIKIQHDWLDTVSSGYCEIKGQKWIFLDLSLSPAEQLSSVVEALASFPELAQREMPDELRQLIGCGSGPKEIDRAA